jgi:hypothetical protein
MNLAIPVLKVLALSRRTTARLLGEVSGSLPEGVQALDTVEDVAEAAHLGGLITQEWTEAFELGEVRSAVAFDLGDIAESISTTYGMSVGDVRADFREWLGMRGPDMAADLVGAWLDDLAGRSGGRAKTEARDSGGVA